MPRKKSKAITKKLTEVERIKAMVDDSIGVTTTWEQNQLKWHKMRMRIKKQKNFPFKGCANLRMPTIETKIRKLKASLVNIVFGIRPVVQAVPTPSGNWETASKIEKFLDHLIMEVIRLKNKAIIGIDQALEKGFYLLKPYWKVDIIKREEEISLDDLSEQEKQAFNHPQATPEIKQAMIASKLDVDLSPMVAEENYQEILRIYNEAEAGKTEIKAEFADVVANRPDVSLCEPEKVYVSAGAGYSPQSARWIIHEFSMDIEDVKRNAEERNWNLGEIRKIEAAAHDYDSEKDIDIEKEMREGLDTLEETGKIKIWEYYGYDLKDTNQKVVMTIAPDFDKKLRKIALPFYSGKLPFVKLFYELCDDRWFAHRGIAELIEDIVKEIDIQHCQKIDQQTIRNTPQYVHRAGMINPTATQFIFGQSHPAQGMQPLDDVIRPLNNNNPNVEFSYEREQMLLETKIEELIGQIDFTLQSMINRRQPRTLGEVELQKQSSQMVFSLDADIIRTSFEDLFTWIWELWCQYGDDDYEFAYFGQEGWEKIRLTKEEVQGKYTITVRGNDQNTNPQIRIQKAQAVIAGATNPIALQAGVVTPLNLFNSYKRFYQELDIPNWEELITAPEQQPQQPSVEQTAPEFRARFKDLADGEKAQVLAAMGVKPDMQHRMLQHQEARADKQAEATQNLVEQFIKKAE